MLKDETIDYWHYARVILKKALMKIHYEADKYVIHKRGNILSVKKQIYKAAKKMDKIIEKEAKARETGKDVW